MGNTGLLEILFSVVFVLLGSFTFHVSSLVSGVSIFRDLPANLSALMALTLGILLFGISPISFIILGTSLTAEPASDEIASAEIKQFAAKLIQAETVIPFMLSAIGFGLIAGALIRVHARTLFLRWLRDKFNLLFHFKTYELSWDAFLSSVKRGGEVTVHLDEITVHGHLAHFSIRGEPPAVWLRGYCVLDPGGSPTATDKRMTGEMLIRCDSIKRISAPSYSFNKRHAPMRYYSLAFYLLFAAIGFFFLSQSLHGTATFLNAGNDVALSQIGNTYSAGSMWLLIIAVITVAVSCNAVRQDCATWRGALDIYPEFFIAAIVLACWFGLTTQDRIWEAVSFAPTYKGVAATAVLSAAAVFSGWLLFRRNRLMRTFAHICSIKDSNYTPTLEEYLEEVYVKFDLNKPYKVQQDELQANMAERFRQFWGQDYISDALALLLEQRPYLKRECAGLLLRLRFYIRKRRRLGEG